MKRTFIFGLVFYYILIIPAFAQDRLLTAYPSAKVIFLTWERLDENQSFNVYRDEGNGRLTKITKNPIRILWYRSDIIETLDEELSLYMELFKVKYPEQIHQKLDKLPSAETIICAINPQIAKIRGRGFLDKTVKAGQKYKYRIFVVENGVDRPYSKAIQLTAKDIIIEKPKNFEAEGANHEINLYWDAPDSPNAGFDIFRSESKDGVYQQINKKRQLLLKVSVTEQERSPVYIDKNIIVNKEYWYKVAARDPIGNLGKFTNPIAATAQDKTPPQKPIIEKPQLNSKGYAIIKWQQIDISDVVDFYVYKSRSINEKGRRLQGEITLDQNKYIFIDQNNEKGFFWYRVAAVDEKGNESLSDAKAINLR